MAVDFSAFDKKVDLDALQEEVKNADLSSFEDVPDGTYIVCFDKMEIKPTKAKSRQYKAEKEMEVRNGKM